MSSKEILVEINEFMGALQNVGKYGVIKDGHITLSVGYDISDPYEVKDNLEKVLATIIKETPSPFGLPPPGDYLNLTQIVINLRSGRIDLEYEVPPLLLPKR